MVLFWAAVILAAGLTLLPGAVVARSLRLGGIDSLGVSGGISACLISIVSIALAWMRLPVSGAKLAILTIALAGAFALLGRALVARSPGCPRRPAHRSDWVLLIAAVAASCAVITAFYLWPLHGLGNFSQMADNMAHLSGVRTLTATGIYTPFGSSSYGQVLNPDQIPFHSSGFYPIVWHALCSVASQVLSVSPSFAENAVNVGFSAIVFPVGMYALIRYIAPDEGLASLAAPILISACASFPLALFVFGPLFPNAAALACMPGTALLFIALMDGIAGRHAVPHLVVLFILSLIGIVLVHPGSAFSLAVLLAPFLVQRSGDLVMEKNGPASKRSLAFRRLAVRVAVAVGIALIWVGFYLAPPLRGVVSFEWPPVYDGLNGAVSIILYRLRLGGAQPLFAALVFLGVMDIFLRRPKLRWLGGSWFFAALIFYVDATQSGTLKQVLAGFWYTDPWRTAANLAIISIPIAVCGLCSIFKLIEARSPRFRAPLMGALAAVIAIGIYGFTGPSRSAFNTAAWWINEWGNPHSSAVPYTVEENSFIDRVMNEVGPDELILNLPFDGSGFAHAFNGINLYYKSISGGRESDDSKEIKRHLADFTHRDRTLKALERVGARYLLVLNPNGFTQDGDTMWSLGGSYAPKEWRGMLAVDDETPGFTCILREGDMRLYRIELPQAAGGEGE